MHGSSLAFFYRMELLMPVTWNTYEAKELARGGPALSEHTSDLAPVDLFDSGSSCNHTFVDTMEDPISTAMWQFLGGIGGYPTSPAATNFVRQANVAWDHLIERPRKRPLPRAMVRNWLTRILTVTPSASGVQGSPDAPGGDTLAKLPESGSVLLCAGIGLIAVGRLRRSKRSHPR